MLACKISHIPGIMHLLTFESSNCFVPTVPTEGQADKFVFCGHGRCRKVSGKQLSREKTLYSLHNKDDIFLYKTLQIDGSVLAQRSYLYSVTNSPSQDTAPTADNRPRQESCP